MINHPGAGAFEFGDGVGSKLLKEATVLIMQSEVCQFVGVVVEIVQFLDFTLDQGSHILVATFRKRNIPRHAGAVI